MVEQFLAKNVEKWRIWLEKNHRKKEKIMLVRYKKHTGYESFNQREAMNEAICFGWIDTTLKRLDDEKYGVTFVKRNKNSRWSYNTFARAEEMIKQGKMSEFGMEMYKLGLSKKPHDHGIPKNPDMPEGLKKELDKKVNRNIKEQFEKLAPSHKKNYYRWILRAKRSETRKKRVKQTIENVKKNKKFGVSGKDV